MAAFAVNSSYLEAYVQSAIDAASANYFQAGYADTLWLMLCGFLVFFMQCGFALLEAGTVRSKNTKNILLKNMMDACVGAIIWFTFGYSLAYDTGNGFIGISGLIGNSSGETASHLFLNNVAGDAEDTTGYTLALWFFQYVFAAAAATIVSGAMAERTALSGYIVYTCVITCFIYPVVVHWGWSGQGWASAFNGEADPAGGGPGTGVQDFAGSGIVHMTGGVAALCGAIIVGPRLGRFDDQGKPNSMPGHSATLQVMGTLILWLGWYGFNPGSTLGLSADGYARDAARVVVTTTMSAACGGICVVCLEKLLGDGTWSLSAVCNGILGGLVSITSGCSVTFPWSAAAIGILGGFVYYGASKLVLKLKIDDPLDAFAVHGACGFWGVFATALFSAPDYSYAAGTGLFYGETVAINAHLVFLLAVIAWVGSTSCAMFGLLKVCGVLRVSKAIEEAGMDVSKHGGDAYSFDSVDKRRFSQATDTPSGSASPASSMGGLMGLGNGNKIV